ncbi:DUF2291 family protein [Sphingomonas koreensis]
MKVIASLRHIDVTALFAVLLGASLLGGCKVLTNEEDRAMRARRGGDFDAARYVEEIWAAKAVPALDRRAVPADKLVPAIDADLERAGVELGRRAGEGSAWTFVVSGTGVVSSVDAASRRGSAEVTFTGIAPARTVRLQIGPIVSGTAIRDALPFVAFNDFTDQLAFADVGRALTARALRTLRPGIAQLRPGQAIRFIGVVNVRAPGEPLVVTPVALSIGMTS